jgi:redox-sensitive bicupin YhaK (pirin superfamily)
VIDRRAFESLGQADFGWLKARHHFSFADYQQPDRVSWGALRVWNDDEIAPGGGFPLHPHANMEIVTYVREGAVTHQDSLGNRGRTKAGDVQVMSAGAGIRHAEYNLEPVTTKIFQIWIMPRQPGGSPKWGAKPFPKGDRAGRFVPLASGYPEDTDALPVGADARVLGATLQAGETAKYSLGNGRRAYLASAKGAFELNGQLIKPRDGAAVQDERVLSVRALDDADLLLVDVT